MEKEVLIALLLGLILGACLSALVLDKGTCPSCVLKEAKQPDCINTCVQKECPKEASSLPISSYCIDQLESLKKKAEIAQQVYDGTKEELKEILK